MRRRPAHPERPSERLERLSQELQVLAEQVKTTVALLREEQERDGHDRRAAPR
jgi:hypothetical protein